MKKFLNTLRISCAVLGGIIGAGFITGREVMRFFYGANPYYSAGLLFVAVFLLIYLLLKVENPNLIFLIKKSSVIINVFNVLILASMIGATDSLGQSIFKISNKIPLFSICLLCISTLTCLNGINKLAKITSVVVPFMILIFLCVSLTLPLSNNKFDNFTGRPIEVFSYATMNVFLIQPFLLKIKEEKGKFSPFGVAFLSSLILVVLIVVFLNVLSDDCLTCDIPIISIVSGNLFLRYIISIIIFIAIFTTLIAVQYPFAYKENKVRPILLILVTVIGFAFSRMGFYVIVDKIYPIISILSLIYYVVIAFVYLLFALKMRPKRTSSRQEYIKAPYSSLQDQALKLARHKR